MHSHQPQGPGCCTPISSERRTRSVYNANSAPVSRCLEKEFAQENTPALTAEDTSVCEKHHEISVSESFLGRMTELVKAEFTSLLVRHHIVEDKALSLCWLEVLSPSVHFDSQFGPCNIIRVMLSQHGLYTTQVLFPLISTINKGMSCYCR